MAALEGFRFDVGLFEEGTSADGEPASSELIEAGEPGEDMTPGEGYGEKGGFNGVGDENGKFRCSRIREDMLAELGVSCSSRVGVSMLKFRGPVQLRFGGEDACQRSWPISLAFTPALNICGHLE